MKTLGSIVCFSLFGFAFGCGDEPSSPAEGGSNGDGGSGGETMPVAGAGEGGGGATPVDTKTTVTVRRVDAPLQDVDVMANDANGALVGHAVTGADGTAELAIPSGGSVSIAYAIELEAATPPSVARNVATMAFSSQVPGAVTFNAVGIASSDPGPTMTQQFTYPPRVGAASYAISTGCGAKDTTSLSVLLNAPDCTGTGSFDAVLVARDALGDIIDYAELSDLPFTGGEFASFAMSWTGVGAVPIELEVAHIPAGSTVAALSWAAAHAAGLGPSVSASHEIDDASGDATFQLRHLSSYGSEHCQRVRVEAPGPDPLVVRHRFQRCSAVADTSDYELDVTRLLRFDPASPTYEPPAIGWTAGTSGDVGDLLIVQQAWERGDDSGSWSIYLEPTARTFVFPTLPADLSPFVFGPDDVLGDTSVTHIDYPEGGFAEAIASGAPRLDSDRFEQVASVIPD